MRWIPHNNFVDMFVWNLINCENCAGQKKKWKSNYRIKIIIKGKFGTTRFYSKRIVVDGIKG